MNRYVLYVNKQAFSWTNGPDKASMANSCFSYIERERDSFEKFKHRVFLRDWKLTEKKMGVCCSSAQKKMLDECRWVLRECACLHLPLTNLFKPWSKPSYPTAVGYSSSLSCIAFSSLQFLTNKKKKIVFLIILVVFDWIDVVNRCPHMVKGHYIFGRS